MAIPKPLRVLAIISVFLLFYLLFQAFKTPPTIHGPDDLEHELPNEPTLQGTTTKLCLFAHADTKQNTANLLHLYGEPMGMLRTIPMHRALMRHFWRW